MRSPRVCFSVFVLLPLALLSAVPAGADCGPPPQAPVGVGTNKDLYSSHVRDLRAWQASCGAGASGGARGYRGSSSGSSGSAAAAAASANNAAMMGMMMGIMQMGIQQSQQNAARHAQEAAEEAERQRLRDAARKRAFESQKNDLLRRMDASSMTPDKGGPARADLEKIGSLHNKEVELRHKALAKLKGSKNENWCKLHLPQAVLLPKLYFNDVGNRDVENIRKFQSDRYAWDKRCGGPSAGGDNDLDRELNVLKTQLSAPPPDPGRAAPSQSGRLAFKDDGLPPEAEAAAMETSTKLEFKDDGPEPARPADLELSRPAPEPELAEELAGQPSVPLDPFEHKQTGLDPMLEGKAPAMLSEKSAPDPKAAWGSVEEVHSYLEPAKIPPAYPGAFEALEAAPEFLVERGAKRTKQTLFAQAIRRYPPYTVLYNMYDLPETLKPKLLAASRGELEPASADLFLFESVNVLYNFGAAPNKVVEKIIAQKNALKGIMIYSQETATDFLRDSAGKGVAIMASAGLADAKFPTDNLVRGKSDPWKIINEGMKSKTPKDLAQDLNKVKEVLNETDLAKTKLWTEPAQEKGP
jgi:hypothetical protein